LAFGSDRQLDESLPMQDEVHSALGTPDEWQRLSPFEDFV